MPILFLHGRDDFTVPFRFGERLFAAAPEPKRFIAIDGAGHDDLHLADPARYYGEIGGFLDQVVPER
jgi:fermentation-respiration switch protein FrsA (DUF1100 family)